MNKKLLLISCLYVSNAIATVMDGNSFLENFNAESTIKRQYLIGYVAGMYDSYENVDKSIATCLGENVRMGQIVDVIGIYLKNNPQIRHYPMHFTFPLAVKSTFKCN